MGFKNSPATFQWMKKLTVLDLSELDVLIYTDDIIFYPCALIAKISKSLEEDEVFPSSIQLKIYQNVQINDSDLRKKLRLILAA